MLLAYLKRIRVLWLSIVCRLESLYLVWSGLHGLSLTSLTASLIALGHPLVQQKEHLYLKDYIGRIHRRQFQASLPSSRAMLCSPQLFFISCTI